MTKTDYGWTHEQVAKMLEMEKRGCSRAEIGQAIGKTRNAVIGKMIRMKDAGDGRMRNCMKTLPDHFTDEQSLTILHLKENEGLSFGKIAARVRSNSIRVEKHYRDIIRELNASECYA